MFNNPSPSPSYYEAPEDPWCETRPCANRTDIVCDNCGAYVCEDHAEPNPEPSSPDKYLCGDCFDDWEDAQSEIEADDAWEPSYDAPGYNLPY